MALRENLFSAIRHHFRIFPNFQLGYSTLPVRNDQVIIVLLFKSHTLIKKFLKIKHLPQLSHRIIRTSHGMSNSPLVLVDLVIISSLVSLVSEEMDLPEVLLGDVSKSEGLVPSVGAEDGQRRE